MLRTKKESPTEAQTLELVEVSLRAGRQIPPGRDKGSLTTPPSQQGEGSGVG